LHSTVWIPAPARNRVERSGEVRAAVADHELDPVRLLAEVHDQVAGLPGGPFPGGMRSDSENPDAPAGVLDHGQDLSLGAIGQFRREEVARQDRLGLGAQEQRPGRIAPPRRRIDAGILQDLRYRRRRDSHSQPGQFAVDPAVAPAGIFAGQPEDQGPDVPAGGWPAALAAYGPCGPAAAGDVACQRRIVSEVTSSRSPCRRAFGITASRVASRARSARSSLGRRGYRRCRTASGGAGSRSLRSSMSPHAGRAAARRLAAWSGGT